MEPVTIISGVAAPLPMINVDTDKIIPGSYLKTVERIGLASGLFEPLRYHPDGSINPDFILNRPGYDKSTIIVAGENFGCGSSREHAPWALLEFGVRCIIAPSFADIFYSNSIKSGLLPIPLPADFVDQLSREAWIKPDARFKIDLSEQSVSTPSGSLFSFAINPRAKHCLLNGLSEIDLTVLSFSEIASFETGQLQRNPWLRLGPVVGASVD